MKLVRNSCKSPGSASALLTKHVGKIYQRFLGVFLKNTQKISYKLLDFFASFFYQEKNEEYEYILSLLFCISFV